MTRQFVFLLILPFLLTSCIPDEGLKRSANNRLLDTQGFHGKKRRPLYNNKYIDKAKHNVARSELDMDEYDEDEQYLGNLNPSIKNRYMYEDMVEEDMESEKVIRAKKRAAYLKTLEKRDKYYNLGNARDRVRESGNDQENSELRVEIQEIKSMLDSARKDLVKYRCPVDEDGEIIIKKHGANPQKIQEEVKNEPVAAPKKSPPPVQSKPKAPKPTPAKPKPQEPLPAIVKPDNVSKPVPQPAQPEKEVVITQPPKPTQQSNVTQPKNTPIAPPPQKNNVRQVEDRPVAAPKENNVRQVESEELQQAGVENLNHMSSSLDQNIAEDVETGEVPIPTLPSESNVSQSAYDEKSVPSLPQFPITE
jgi:hypothetical protein